MPELIKGLVFLFPVCFGVVKSWHSTILFVLVFIGLFLCRGQWNRTEKEVKIVLIALLALFAVASLSLINADDLYQGIKRLTKLAYFLGLYPLFFAARRMKVDLSKYYVAGAMVGSFVMLGTALYQVQHLGIPRAHGVTNPIIFGGIAMFHGLLIFGFLLGTFRRATLRVLGVMSMVCAFSASFLSLSRGAWIALPVGLGILLFLFVRQSRLKSVAVTCLLLLLLSGGIAGIYGDKIAARFDRTVENIELYLEGKNRNSSTGQRFLMWGIAFEMFRDNPVVGSGIGDFRYDALKMMEKDKTDLIEDHGHAHNVFFEFLGTTGVLGLFAMTMAVLVLPFRYLYRQWRTASPENQGAAVGGMMLISSFFVFGLTESWLSRSPFVSVYVVGLFVFFSTYLCSSRDEQKEQI